MTPRRRFHTYNISIYTSRTCHLHTCAAWHPSGPSSSDGSCCDDFLLPCTCVYAISNTLAFLTIACKPTSRDSTNPSGNTSVTSISYTEICVKSDRPFPYENATLPNNNNTTSTLQHITYKKGCAVYDLRSSIRRIYTRYTYIHGNFRTIRILQGHFLLSPRPYIQIKILRCLCKALVSYFPKLSF